MNKRKQLIAKAGLAFLYCISCCAFANYVTYMVIKSYTDGGMFADLWFFLVYVIQVAAAVMAAVYGDILLKRGKPVVFPGLCYPSGSCCHGCRLRGYSAEERKAVERLAQYEGIAGRILRN